jgi:two-component system chemotaxis response regulator CheY
MEKEYLTKQTAFFHILVVDDQDMNRQLIGAIITAEGGRVTEAASALHALEYLSAGVVFDGITTDYNMPKMNGIDFIKTLRAMPLYTNTPVALITAQVQSSIPQNAESAGADTCIDKLSLISGILEWLEKNNITRVSFSPN